MLDSICPFTLCKSQVSTPYTIEHVPRLLKKKGLTALMTGIPLDSYHACLPHVDDSLAITQLALAVSFGKYITPPPRSFPRIDPSVCPHRCCSFSPRRRANANPQSEEPRDGCFDHSECGHQRRGNILPVRIRDPPLGSNYVCRGEGRNLSP